MEHTEKPKWLLVWAILIAAAISFTSYAANAENYWDNFLSREYVLKKDGNIIKNAWVYDENENWHYFDGNGVMAVSCFVQEPDGSSYYICDDGKMLIADLHSGNMDICVNVTHDGTFGRILDIRFKNSSPITVQTITKPASYRMSELVTCDVQSRIVVSDKEIDTLLALINKERAAAGVQRVTLSKEISQIAATRAEETTRYWSHERPDRTNLGALLDAGGIEWQNYGEILAKGENCDLQTIMDSWTNSSSHKAVITQPLFVYAGVGEAMSPTGEKYISVVFYKPR